MANTTISELPLAGPITGAEVIPVVQNGTTVKTTAGALFSQGVTNASTNIVPFATYGTNYMGANVFSPSEDQNKFVALADGSPGNYLTFQFIGGSINGINIAKNNPLVGTSITLTPTTVTFEDNGQGIVPNQYTDFINSIFEGFNLVSRIVTNNINTVTTDPPYGGTPYWNQVNYCNADTFFLMFQETGSVLQGGGNVSMTVPYGFKSYNGVGGFDLFGAQGQNLNDFQNMATFISQLDTQFNNEKPFLQQY